jgi:hypothetical protein
MVEMPGELSTNAPVDLFRMGNASRPRLDNDRIARDQRDPLSRLTHYSLRPARYMTLLEFVGAPQILATRQRGHSCCKEVQVDPKSAVDKLTDLALDVKALKAVIGAVRHQLTNWERVREADVGEDEFVDLQNDIT